jgi:hypothetical protein
MRQEVKGASPRFRNGIMKLNLKAGEGYKDQGRQAFLPEVEILVISFRIQHFKAKFANLVGKEGQFGEAIYLLTAPIQKDILGHRLFRVNNHVSL